MILHDTPKIWLPKLALSKDNNSRYPSMEQGDLSPGQRTIGNLGVLRTREMVFSKREHHNRLSTMKWSLKSCTFKQHWIDSEVTKEVAARNFREIVIGKQQQQKHKKKTKTHTSRGKLTITPGILFIAKVTLPVRASEEEIPQPGLPLTFLFTQKEENMLRKDSKVGLGRSLSW